MIHQSSAREDGGDTLPTLLTVSGAVEGQSLTDQAVLQCSMALMATGTARCVGEPLATSRDLLMDLLALSMPSLPQRQSMGSMLTVSALPTATLALTSGHLLWEFTSWEVAVISITVLAMEVQVHHRLLKTTTSVRQETTLLT